MLKEIALRIAVLAEADREWLMAELSDPERKRLRPLLAEISELGLNQDAVVLDALSERMDPPSPAVPPAASGAICHEEWSRLPAFLREVLLPGAEPSVTEQRFQELMTEPTKRAPRLRQCLVETVIAAREIDHD